MTRCREMRTSAGRIKRKIEKKSLRMTRPARNTTERLPGANGWREPRISRHNNLNGGHISLRRLWVMAVVADANDLGLITTGRPAQVSWALWVRRDGGGPISVSSPPAFDWSLYVWTILAREEEIHRWECDGDYSFLIAKLWSVDLVNSIINGWLINIETKIGKIINGEEKVFNVWDMCHWISA